MVSEILKRSRDKGQAEKNKLKDVPCADCGRRFRSEVMCIYRLDKINTKPPSLVRSAKAVRKLMEYCVILCSNCSFIRYYNDNPLKIDKYVGYQKEDKDFLLRLKDKPCAICGVQYHHAAMQFHHINPKNKIAQVPKLNSMKKRLEEASKCEILCANCHFTMEWNIKRPLEIMVSS